MPSPDAERFHADHVSEWADWLTAHHERTEGVWLVRWRRGHGPQLDYDEVMQEALRFGWIDGQAKTVDETRSMLWFRQRRPGSQWSALSKDRVARVVAQGRMEPAGQRVIDAAKADGSWSVLDSVEALIEPDALRAALDADPAARMHWDAFPPSARKMGLARIALAKREQTRQRLITELVAKAARDERP